MTPDTPVPRKCEAWINVQSLYDSPVVGRVPPHRLYCTVPAGKLHPVVTDDPDNVATSYPMHTAKAIWWPARSVPEDAYALDAEARLASLPDATVTLSGTIEPLPEDRRDD